MSNAQINIAALAKAWGVAVDEITVHGNQITVTVNGSPYLTGCNDLKRLLDTFAVMEFNDLIGRTGIVSLPDNFTVTCEVIS